MDSEMTTNGMSNNAKIWLGIAVGAAVGIGIALSRRGHRTRWDEVTRRIGEKSGDFGEVSRDIADRIKTIYEETRRVVEDAGEMWAHGRKLVGR